MTDVLQIAFFENKKNFTSMFLKSGDIAIQSEKNIFFQIWRSHFRDPPGGSFSYDFSGKDILRKKTSAIECTKIRTITPSSWPRWWRGVGNWAGCSTRNLIHSTTFGPKLLKSKRCRWNIILWALRLKYKWLVLFQQEVNIWKFIEYSHSKTN